METFKKQINRYQCDCQGRRQRGGQWCPAHPFEICAPHFTFGPLVAAYIQYSILKMWPPLLVFGPSFWFLAPLLLNPGDCSCSATMLTSEIIPEIIEKHSEFSCYA